MGGRVVTSSAQGPAGGGLGALPAESPAPAERLLSSLGRPQAPALPGWGSWSGRTGHNPGPNFPPPRLRGAVTLIPSGGLSLCGCGWRPEVTFSPCVESPPGASPHALAAGSLTLSRRGGESCTWSLGPSPTQSGSRIQSLMWGGGCCWESGTPAPHQRVGVLRGGEKLLRISFPVFPRD